MIVYGTTEQETIQLTATSFGIPLAEAEQLLAIARGEVSGKFALPGKRVTAGKVRIILSSASRKKLERLGERLHQSKTSDSQSLTSRSILKDKKSQSTRDATANLAKRAVKPETV